MNAWFEITLCGSDEEHLQAVAEAGLDEVARIESRLSRFAPTSELFRINREAASRPVQIDYEMLAILQTCRDAWLRTAGYFNPMAPSAREKQTPAPTFDAVEIDASRRTVYFTNAELRIDLGGFAKGYGLDRAGEILEQHGVYSALLHGGTSSILALDGPTEQSCWQVGVRDPSTGSELLQLPLARRGLSSSAAFDSGVSLASSDVIDPIAGTPLAEQASCVVLAGSAAQAEVLSTALLAMGKTRAEEYIRSRGCDGAHVGWIEPAAASSRFKWLSESP